MKKATLFVCLTLCATPALAKNIIREPFCLQNKTVHITHAPNFFVDWAPSVKVYPGPCKPKKKEAKILRLLKAMQEFSWDAKESEPKARSALQESLEEEFCEDQGKECKALAQFVANQQVENVEDL